MTLAMAACWVALAVSACVASAPAPWLHNKAADRDADNVTDHADRCPDAPEDRDGFEDDDGCPDLDNDGDGIPDRADPCPNDIETINGMDDEDGCPDSR
jgi:large repetitive protein